MLNIGHEVDLFCLYVNHISHEINLFCLCVNHISHEVNLLQQFYYILIDFQKKNSGGKKCENIIVAYSMSLLVNVSKGNYSQVVKGLGYM